MTLALINPVNLWESFLVVFGGLGIFLYGINLMGDSLKDLAGSKLKMIIEKSTNTPLKGILVGALLTVIIQSSSGTTALTVGLVRAGLMTLPQAIGVIMGANIGTCITAFMISLHIAESSLIFVGLGAILIFFVNNRKIKELGKVICGFGLLFFGLDAMGGGLDFLLTTYQAETEALFRTLGNFPILGLTIGTIVTAVVQSSSATIGIIQELFATGQLTLLAVLPMVIGANVGTTVTAVIASIGGNTESKRTSLFHLCFNVLGAVFFMIILRFAFVPLMEIIDKAIDAATGYTPGGSIEKPSWTIALAHLFFNVITTFVLFFFIKPITKFICRMIKDTKSEEYEGGKLLEELLDYSLIKKSPSLALKFIDKCVNYMGFLVDNYYAGAQAYATGQEGTKLEELAKIEDAIDSFDKRIHDYLINLTLESLHETETKQISKYLDIIKDYERIGDHCSNLVEFFESRYERKLELSLDSRQDLSQMFESVSLMVTNAVKSVDNLDKDAAKIVEETESKVDMMQEVFHERHLHRLNSGTCSYENSDYYVEILSNLERIGDHCKNVADAILSLNRSSNIENNDL